MGLFRRKKEIEYSEDPAKVPDRHDESYILKKELRTSDKFREKKHERPSWKLSSHREWYKELPNNPDLKDDSIEEFGNVKVHSTQQLLKNKKQAGEYLFGEKPSPEPLEKHIVFYRILKLEELIEPFRVCRFCNNPTEILILEYVENDIMVCCHDHRIDGFATFSEQEYEDAKITYDQMIRFFTKKYSENS